MISLMSNHPGRVLCILFVALAMISGGCASQYNIIEPKELAQTVDPAGESRFTHQGIDYVIREVDGRLTLRVINTSGESMELMPGSRVFDPTGAAHLLEPRQIAKNESYKIELPPVAGVASNARGGGAMPDATAGSVDGAVYRTEMRQQPVIRKPGDPMPQPVWAWRNESNVRVALRIRSGQTETSHLFLIRKAAK